MKQNGAMEFFTSVHLYIPVGLNRFFFLSSTLYIHFVLCHIRLHKIMCQILTNKYLNFLMYNKVRDENSELNRVGQKILKKFCFIGYSTQTMSIKMLIICKIRGGMYGGQERQNKFQENVNLVCPSRSPQICNICCSHSREISKNVLWFIIKLEENQL